MNEEKILIFALRKHLKKIDWKEIHFKIKKGPSYYERSSYGSGFGTDYYKIYKVRLTPNGKTYKLRHYYGELFGKKSKWLEYNNQIVKVKHFTLFIVN